MYVVAHKQYMRETLSRYQIISVALVALDNIQVLLYFTQAYYCLHGATCYPSCDVVHELISIRPMISSHVALIDAHDLDTLPYQYEDISRDHNEIRLVILLPGTYLDPVRCCIITAQLESPPEYTAISYTWATEDGDDSKSQKIYVAKEHEGYRIFNVTVNCKEALKQVRLADNERILWIDSICIDQSRIYERNHQVQLMDQIYKNASLVEICIQAPQRDYRRAMQILAPIDFPRALLRTNLAPDPYIRQLRSLLDRRYFGRVWVGQISGNPYRGHRIDSKLTLSSR